MDAKMLDGKVAIISGASYGMGETMAELFAKEGAKVVMTARGKEKLDAAVDALKAQDYDVTGVVADNKELTDVQNVIQTALDAYGDLDIVINNAAIGEQKMIDETDDEWLEHMYQTNVFGPFRFIRESLKIFLPKNEGCIINISSVNGDRPFCGASYTSSTGRSSKSKSGLPIFISSGICRSAHRRGNPVMSKGIGALPQRAKMGWVYTQTLLAQLPGNPDKLSYTDFNIMLTFK